MSRSKLQAIELALLYPYFLLAFHGDEEYDRLFLGAGNLYLARWLINQFNIVEMV